nr:hypothetical protein [uncultured Chitinophaga sp.]
MKKKIADNIKVFLLTTILILLVRLAGDFPWWSFVVFLVPAGMAMRYKKWQAAFFIAGFLSGFLIWTGASLYFEYTGNGIVLQKTALLLGTSRVLVVLGTGMIGGLISGLSLFTGATVMSAGKPMMFINNGAITDKINL